MKKLRSFLIPLLLLLGVIFLQILFSREFTTLPPRVEVLSLDVQIENSQALQPFELKKLTGYQVAFQQGTSGDILGQPVNVIIANGLYGPFLGRELIQGTFFTEQASHLGLNVAVISEELAIQAYGTPAVIEDTIEINHHAYRIVGVYQKNSLLYALSSNGREDVYIPVNSDFHREVGSDQGIQRMMINLDQEGAGAFIENKILRDLRGVSRNAENYRVKDYTKAGIIIRQFPRITGFIAAMMLILCVWHGMLKTLKSKVKRIRKKLELLTLREIIMEDPSGYMISLLSILISLMGMILLYRLSAFKIYIPPRYIPSERLLQFDYYREIILQGLQFRNLYPGLTPSPYGRLYGLQLLINTLFLVIEMLLIVKLYRCIKSLMTAWEGDGV